VTVRRLFLGPLLPALAVLACRATTSRPEYLPLPAAAMAEVELEIPEATRVLAEALARDSITLAVVREADGFIDSGWLSSADLEPTRAQPLGTGVVRVRAWVNPAKQFWSELVVEASYRALTDPSRPDRELDVPLPDDHPVQRRVAAVIRRLIEQHGDPSLLPARPDTARVKPDTARVKPDTGTVKPDTSSSGVSR
jgi:hypothetical protein